MFRILVAIVLLADVIPCGSRRASREGDWLRYGCDGAPAFVVEAPTGKTFGEARQQLYQALWRHGALTVATTQQERDAVQALLGDVLREAKAEPRGENARIVLALADWERRLESAPGLPEAKARLAERSAKVYAAERDRKGKECVKP